jgi:hypothetical protein
MIETNDASITGGQSVATAQSHTASSLAAMQAELMQITARLAAVVKILQEVE